LNLAYQFEPTNSDSPLVKATEAKLGARSGDNDFEVMAMEMYRSHKALTCKKMY